MAEHSSADGTGRTRRVRVIVDVDAVTSEDALATVGAALRRAFTADGRDAEDEGRDRVRAWSFGEDLPDAWEPLLDSGIPEIVAEMFPPEPLQDQFRLPHGEPDADAFYEAHDQWRDECLSLAVGASHLPKLLTELENTQRVRDGLLDVMERHVLSPRPDPLHFYDAITDAVDETVFRNAERVWQQEALTTLLMQNEALEQLVRDGGPRTQYLPAQFHQEWIPADLLAVTTLRELLEQPTAVTGRLLGREQRQELAAMLFAADPEVSIADPDSPDGMPIYEGQASEAHRWIIPGVYQATGTDGQGEFRVVVGRSPVGNTATASAAFPPAEHDSTVLNQIARVLEEAAQADSDHDFNYVLPDTALRRVVERIDTLVAATGRTAGDGGALIERGALLSDLLAQRAQSLHPDENRRQGRDQPGDTDLFR